MKATLALLAFVLLLPAAARAQDARLRLDSIDRLAAKASEKVIVDITPEMIKAFALPMVPNKPGADVAKQLLSELRGIYVRTFEFEDDNAFSQDDMNALRKQLMGPGWVRIISIAEKGDREVVEVHSFMQGGRSNGLAILVSEPRELTVVNIVGPIDLTKLPALGGQFGIPQGIPGLSGK